MNAWIEAVRLRTLPVSLAGVVAGLALALQAGCWRWQPAVLCLAFATLAQVASNFANEYFDYKGGLDRPGREGPRRGVTEGDISPASMKWASLATLAAACVAGCALLCYGSWWMLPIGIVTVLGALAYSAGPYPLSHHGLGEAAVIVFFGIVPVSLTFYLQTGGFSPASMLSAVAIGLMGANVLIVNNYRDRADDLSVGKRTLAVILGNQAVRAIYLVNGYAAVALMAGVWSRLPLAWCVIPIAYLCAHTAIWVQLGRRSGRSLTPLLGMTAVAMAAYACALFIASAI